MGSVKAKGQASRAKRPKSDLRKKVWAVITHGDGVTSDLTHDAAMKLAKKTGGYVTTREAILRCD
jgi:hypothetical protein